jgi:curved DNA-binding protein CbpA
MAVSNHFDLLRLPPRASLDEEALQQAYLAASRSAHPDQPGGDAALSAELNAALETLRSPVTRLRHLIDTQSQTPWRAVPLEPAMMRLFESLGPLLQQSQAFLKRKQSAGSALSRALLAGEELQLREALETLNEEIETRWQAMEEQLRFYDQRIAAGDGAVWQDLQAEQARFAYLSKWRGQIREALLGLML